MSDLKERIVYMDPSVLVPYEKNARIHGSEMEFLKNSITEFGFRNPILVDANNVIIAGHGRRMAALELGLKKVPVIVCDDLTDDQVRALRLSDNRTSDLSGWSYDILTDELAALKDIGWDMAQFSFEDITFGPEEPKEEEFKPEIVEYVEDTAPTGDVAPEYRLLVLLDSEEAQNAVYEQLSDMGLRCRKLD